MGTMLGLGLGLSFASTASGGAAPTYPWTGKSATIIDTDFTDDVDDGAALELDLVAMVAGVHQIVLINVSSTTDAAIGAVQAYLQDFATRSGYPTIANIPLSCYKGATGSYSDKFAAGVVTALNPTAPARTDASWTDDVTGLTTALTNYSSVTIKMWGGHVSIARLMAAQAALVTSNVSRILISGDPNTVSTVSYNFGVDPASTKAVFAFSGPPLIVCDRNGGLDALAGPGQHETTSSHVLRRMYELATTNGLSMRLGRRDSFDAMSALFGAEGLSTLFYERSDSSTTGGGTVDINASINEVFTGPAGASRYTAATGGKAGWVDRSLSVTNSEMALQITKRLKTYPGAAEPTASSFISDFTTGSGLVLATNVSGFNGSLGGLPVADAGNDPTWVTVGGRPVLQFDGNDYAVLPWAPNMNAATFTVSIMCLITSATIAAQTALIGLSDIGVNIFDLQVKTTGHLILLGDSTGSTATTTMATETAASPMMVANSTTPAIISMFVDNANTQVRFSLNGGNGIANGGGALADSLKSLASGPVYSAKDRPARFSLGSRLVGTADSSGLTGQIADVAFTAGSNDIAAQYAALKLKAPSTWVFP